MSELQQIQMLSRYAAWANDRLYEVLANLPGQELTKSRPIVFGSILRTLHHVYAMDLVWRSHLQGTSQGFTTRNPEECPPFTELRAAQKEIDRWYIQYTTNMQESDCGEIVLHVVNHTTYHRGHIGTMIYAVPAEPATTDLPVFLREHAKE
jgi:uncharacterized damage-inducible protein DinB